MKDFDLLVIGGAAGASWGGPAGWSAFVHVPSTTESKKLVGAQEDLAIQRADPLPFAAAVQWYHNRYGVNRRPGTKVNVLCCTDSLMLARAGAKTIQRHCEDWVYLEWFEQRDYELTWHWTSRDQCPAVYLEAEHARRTFASAIRGGTAVPGRSGSDDPACVGSAFAVP